MAPKHREIAYPVWIFQFGVGIDYVLRPVGYVLDKHVSPVKLSFLILFIYLLIRS